MAENVQDFWISKRISFAIGLQPAWLWFQNRCALVSGITWGSLGLLAGPAALLKQVPNGYKIRFGQFIITT